MLPQHHLFAPALEVFRPLVSAAINKVLLTDPQISKRLNRLEGKLLAVEITELPYFFLWVNKGQFQLLWETSEHPDGTIRTGLLSTLKPKPQLNGCSLHDSSKYEVLGDPDTVRAVQTLFSGFEPDWEEQLAGIVGDVVARKAGQSVRITAKWIQNASRSAMQNFSEYLQEERQVLVTHRRIGCYLDEVAQLQWSVDALERRLTLLGCLAE